MGMIEKTKAGDRKGSIELDEIVSLSRLEKITVNLIGEDFNDE